MISVRRNNFKGQEDTSKGRDFILLRRADTASAATEVSKAAVKAYLAALGFGKDSVRVGAGTQSLPTNHATQTTVNMEWGIHCASDEAAELMNTYGTSVPGYEGIRMIWATGFTRLRAEYARGEDGGGGIYAKLEKTVLAAGGRALGFMARVVGEDAGERFKVGGHDVLSSALAASYRTLRKERKSPNTSSATKMRGGRFGDAITRTVQSLRDGHPDAVSTALALESVVLRAMRKRRQAVVAHKQQEWNNKLKEAYKTDPGTFLKMLRSKGRHKGSGAVAELDEDGRPVGDATDRRKNVEDTYEG
jgi:hypothetical protein